jgi:hypothetical protein
LSLNYRQALIVRRNLWRSAGLQQRHILLRAKDAGVFPLTRGKSSL